MEKLKVKLEDNKKRNETEMGGDAILNEKGDGTAERKNPIDPMFMEDIIENVFSNLGLEDLLSSRQVCTFWNKFAVPHVRTKQASSLLRTDEDIDRFMGVMDNCYYFPCSKFCFNFYRVSTAKLQQFCRKYGSYARDCEIISEYLYCGNTFEEIQERKAPSVNRKVAIFLANSPALRTLKVRTRFEVSFKQEEIQYLPKVYSNLEFLKTQCQLPTIELNQTNMVSIIVSRAPKLKKLSLRMWNHLYEEAGKFHVLNKRLPEILKNLLTTPKLTIQTMFTGRDYEVVEQLANIPMNLTKMLVKYHLQGMETTVRQETFLRWFVTWLTRCEEHLKIIGLTTDGSEYVRLPPLKNLQHLEMFFNEIWHYPNIAITPFTLNQFPHLFSVVLDAYDPRHWETPDTNICVMSSVRCLEIGCNAGNAAPTASPVIWRVMFPNMDSLTLRSPSVIQLSMVVGELNHLRIIRIYDMDVADLAGRRKMAELLGIEIAATQDWVWNLFTNRATRIPDAELLTFDPAQEPVPDLGNAPLANFTALETLTFVNCCKDALRAVIYTSRTGRLRWLQRLCIIGEEDDVSAEALEILKQLHARVCFHLSGEASEHEQNEYFIS